MATTKTTTPRTGAKSGTRAKSATAKAGTAKTTTAKSASRSTTPRAKTDDSLVARTGRTIKERPYTSAAIATGAVGVVAAAAAAGAFLVSRRDKSFKEASGELSDKVKDGIASASETVKDGIASASETVRDLGQRGADFFKGDASDTGSDTGNETRSQREIAEEALTLKATGAATNPAEELASTELKAGAISY
jgi:ElaB/YqjD/DUF883 family membrane-anchored ribosome-binding protein